MNTWKLEEFDLDVGSWSKRESLLAQGNGYFGWRGTFEEGPGLEGCYVNGFYENYPVKYPEIAYGYPEVGQSMLNVMNPKPIYIEVDGERVSMESRGVSDYHRELDFRTGLLTRTFTYTTASGKALRVAFQRLVSLSRQHVGAVRCSVTPLNFSGELRLISALCTRTSNQAADKDPRVGTHLPPQCFQLLEAGERNGVLYASQRTLESRLPIACAAAHTLNCPAQAGYREAEGVLQMSYAIQAKQGQTVELEKVIAFHARTRPVAEDQLSLALEEVMEARKTGFEVLLRENVAFLAAYWNRADIRVEGDELLQQGLRFNSFHLLQSAGRDGERSIAAKGLTGEGYEGHYFWDTEMYVIPSMMYHSPAICRSLLEFRYRGLDDARRRAREMGHPTGALYPWRVISGTECSTFFPAGTAQYHLNGDIALAVKNYVQSSGDREFLAEQGAEILFETARLWYDVGHFSPGRDGQFCIHCVTGPDEYTAIVDNNHYTNRIARENLWYAHRVYGQLERECPEQLRALCEKIGLAAEEPANWKRAGDRMCFPYDEELGIFLQDDSFAGKKPWDFAGTPKDQYPLLLHYHPLVIYRHKVLKQADTVLADFVLDQYLDEAQIKRDYDYYEPYTTHDSSLSACIHSIVASRVGYLDKAYDYFLRCARTDLDDHKGNTRDGVHIANMAGTAMCIINGFAGVRQWEGELRLRPVRVARWAGYSFRLTFQGRLIEVQVDGDGVLLTLLEGDPLRLRCWEEEVELGATPIRMAVPA